MRLVCNGGFEEPELPDGEYTDTDGPCWKLGFYDILSDPTLWMPGGADGGVWNPDAASGFTGGAFAGENTGWATSSIGYDAGLSQVLDVTLEEDTEYLLSLEVGNPFYNESDLTAPYRVELLAGGVLLASDTDESPVADTWQEHTLVYNSADNPEQVGEPLEIRLVAVEYADGGGVDGYEVDFDEVVLTFTSAPQGKSFVRGDANADGIINITDGIFVLNFLFLGGTTPPCEDAADSNGSNDINITDGIYILNFLFLGGENPAAPWPDCGPDPDNDISVTCETSHPGCGL